MKKLIALSILMGIFASAGFAESSISISGTAEAALVPLQIVSTENDTYIGAGLGRPEDSEAPMVKLIATGDYEGKVGAKAELQFHYNTTYANGGTQFKVGDFAELWFKPTDWFKLDVGRFNEDKLRGKVARDNWYAWTVKQDSKDGIFTRLQGKAGALAAFTPVEGLYIGILVPNFAQFATEDPFLTGSPNFASTASPDNGWRAAQIFKGIQGAVGYEIQGVGLIRAQYVGSKNTKGASASNPYTDSLGVIGLYNALKSTSIGYTPARIEAAFAFTGMEGLVLDFGLKFWLPFDSFVGNTQDPTDPDNYGDTKLYGSLMLPVQLALGATYQLGDIGIAGRIDASFAGSYTSDAGVANDDINFPFYLNVHLWPSYNLSFATIGLDFGLMFQGKTTNGDGDIYGENPTSKGRNGGIKVGFGAWLKKGFGNSSVKLGLAYKVGTELDGADQAGVFSVPILFSYAF